MMGVFVQLNEGSLRAKCQPVGYVIQENGCWEWVGGISDNGYGRWNTTTRSRYAHRVVYEMHLGVVPKGLHLDHLCRNRLCVNPDHLEPVTCKTNILRGVGFSARNAGKTHCIHGHNDWVRVRNGRQCRTCSNDRQRKMYHAKRAKGI